MSNTKFKRADVAKIWSQGSGESQIQKKVVAKRKASEGLDQGSDA
jgi:hypothetical protein